MPIVNREDDRDDPVTLEIVKQAFWKRCVNGTDPVSRNRYVRFVGNKPGLDGYADRHEPIAIWEPKGPNDDFNLVLSLCTDGMHRPLVDADQLTYDWNSERLPGSKLHRSSVVPSTSHWHVYHHMGRSFGDQLKVLGGNPKYAANVQRAGFATLRPPWVHKGWAEAGFWKSEFHGFEDADWQEPVPEPDGKIGWEDLFGGN